MRWVPQTRAGKRIYERSDRNWFKVRKCVVKRLREGWSVQQVVNVYGVCKAFVYKWWNRWLESKTWDALRDRPSTPHTIRRKKWKYAATVIETRKAHPEMGAQKIKAYLGDKIDLSHQSIHEILREEGLVRPGKKVRRRWRQFARYHSNSLWQIDITELEDGGPYLVSIIDDHSRFVIASAVVEHATKSVILGILRKAIRMFGKPRQILTDHGSQFFANKGGCSEFDAFCRSLGIQHILAGVRKPTTIGKVERWHRTVKAELGVKCRDLDEFKTRLPDYVAWYNSERPHWGLGLRTPAAVYFADFILPEDFASSASVYKVP